MNWQRIFAAFLAGLEEALVWFVRHPSRALAAAFVAGFLFSSAFRSSVIEAALTLAILYGCWIFVFRRRGRH